MQTIRIAAAQTAEIREDVDAALRCAVDFIARAESVGVSLLCFPEGFLQGYLTEMQVARGAALDLASPVFRGIVEGLPKTGQMIIMGMIEVEDGQLFNTAVVMQGGVVIGRYRKMHLLGSERIFSAGADNPVFNVTGLRFGINICHDTNFAAAAQVIAEKGANLIVCPANNMLRRDVAERFKDTHNAIRGERCRETGLWLISADVAGDREDRIGWGPTAVLDPAGRVVAQLPLGEPGLLVFDMPIPG